MLARHVASLDLYDTNEPSPQWLQEQCRKTEDAARTVEGITNSEGASANYGTSTYMLATSNGFSGSYKTSHASLYVSVLAGTGTAIERDDDFSSTRFISDLAPAETLGKNAAKRTLARLNPRKPATSMMPVVFDPRVAKSLLGAFSGAINGNAIARGTSFLKNSMGQQIFGDKINVIDDPHRLRGLGSRPFDGEGVENRKRLLVENGVLTTWLLDMRSANRLKMVTTGHASRGLSSPPSPASTNLYLAAGTVLPQELISDIKTGFYVTEISGMGVNLVTGDYSQGAAGFMIENGKKTYPVSEVTIAGNLSDMFRMLTPANDLEFKYATNSPTVRIESMTVAGV
jgi:PmbA protein